MFGSHDLETAKCIAEKISAHIQARCKVFPAKDDPTKYTVGVPLASFNLSELKALLPEEDWKLVQGTALEAPR